MQDRVRSVGKANKIPEEFENNPQKWLQRSTHPYAPFTGDPLEWSSWVYDDGTRCASDCSASWPSKAVPLVTGTHRAWPSVSPVAARTERWTHKLRNSCNLCTSMPQTPRARLRSTYPTLTARLHATGFTVMAQSVRSNVGTLAVTLLRENSTECAF